MKYRRERNEFGLDEYNERDVRNERNSGAMFWIFAGLAAISFVAGMRFYASNPPKWRTTSDEI
jgi:hypothetical protein